MASVVNPVALHLVKLCVGVPSMEVLQSLHEGEDVREHITRAMPKRWEQLLDGGSLYWVMGGFITCRQALLAIEPIFDGIRRCALVMDGTVVPTEPTPHRPFQGWRYLETPPPDLF